MRSNMKRVGFNTKSRGIYKITNTINGKVYIGRTNNFYKRYHQHLTAYRKQDPKKSNQYLLNSYNKYGFDNFTFEEIYYCLCEDECKTMENHFMGLYNSHDSSFGYNLRKDTDGGMLVSEETSAKISKRLKAEWASGVRDGHSDKLKNAWVDRDREVQSLLMSKTLTKYYYCINDCFSVKLHYKDLVELGLKSVISNFFRKKSDRVLCKGYIVERFRYES